MFVNRAAARFPVRCFIALTIPTRPRPLHAGSRFDGDSFNDKISALKRKPIQSFDSPKGAQQLISPNGSPLKAIGIFRSAKQKIDNDGFSRHVKSA